MDDWQEAAFSTRHVHNRAGKSKFGGGRGRRGGGAFEVKRAFGRYDVKCPSAARLTAVASEKESKKTMGPGMDIFRLSDDGRGLLGELLLPGALEAKVILAGSRKTLDDLISQFEKDDDEDEDENVEEEEEEEEPPQREQDGGSGDDDAPQDGNLEASEHEEEDRERSRFQNFEKNSFRSPKFWFQWKGQVLKSSTSPTDGDEGSATGGTKSGRGYVVFSGNDCRSFKGTISCDALGWKDVSLSGWKEVSMSERDVAFAWS